MNTKLGKFLPIPLILVAIVGALLLGCNRGNHNEVPPPKKVSTHPIWVEGSKVTANPIDLFVALEPCLGEELVATMNWDALSWTDDWAIAEYLSARKEPIPPRLSLALCRKAESPRQLGSAVIFATDKELQASLIDRLIAMVKTKYEAKKSLDHPIAYILKYEVVEPRSAFIGDEEYKLRWSEDATMFFLSRLEFKDLASFEFFTKIPTKVYFAALDARSLTAEDYDCLLENYDTLQYYRVGRGWSEREWRSELDSWLRMKVASRRWSPENLQAFGYQSLRTGFLDEAIRDNIPYATFSWLAGMYNNFSKGDNMRAEILDEMRERASKPEELFAMTKIVPDSEKGVWNERFCESLNK